MLTATAVAFGRHTVQTRRVVPAMDMNALSRQLSELDSVEANLASSVSGSLPCCVPSSDVRVRRRRRRNRLRSRSMQVSDEVEECDDYDVDIYVRANVSTDAIFSATLMPTFIDMVNQASNVSTSHLHPSHAPMT